MCWRPYGPGELRLPVAVPFGCWMAERCCFDSLEPSRSGSKTESMGFVFVRIFVSV